MESLPTPPWKIVVLDTGVCGNTFEMVRKVADQVPNVTPILAEIGSLVDEAAASLDQPSILGPLLTRNHELLARLGVSTPALDACVSFALENGCYGAKLSGAGGGGVVIALTERPDQLVEEALAQGLSAFTCAPARPRAAPQ
jgi:mevalonate kinase